MLCMLGMLGMLFCASDLGGGGGGAMELWWGLGMNGIKLPWFFADLLELDRDILV
jgi:hypothetical protein